jgi:hypothetical protein
MPSLHGDPRHRVDEPTLHDIAEKLRRHGIPGEESLWHSELERIGK